MWLRLCRCVALYQIIRVYCKYLCWKYLILYIYLTMYKYLTLYISHLLPSTCHLLLRTSSPGNGWSKSWSNLLTAWYCLPLPLLSSCDFNCSGCVCFFNILFCSIFLINCTFMVLCSRIRKYWILIQIKQPYKTSRCVLINEWGCFKK